MHADHILLFIHFRSKYLEAFPSDCGAWAEFAALEGWVGETERSRAVFELAIRQPVLDMPETLWKAYIDFEVRGGIEDGGPGVFVPRPLFFVGWGF